MEQGAAHPDLAGELADVITLTRQAGDDPQPVWIGQGCQRAQELIA
jgi:hypothetical protein